MSGFHCPLGAHSPLSHTPFSIPPSAGKSTEVALVLSEPIPMQMTIQLKKGQNIDNYREFMYGIVEIRVLYVKLKYR